MFDFAFSEIALIGVVALIAIGPKDMPLAIKTVAGLVKKARRMAGEFQTHVDEMVREANLHDVRDTINEIRSMDLRGRITRAVDSDGSIARALKDDPFKASAPAGPPAAADILAPAIDAPAIDAPAIDAPASLAHDAPTQAAPAFVPPGAAAELAPPPASPPPAFIPPGAADPLGTKDHAA